MGIQEGNERFARDQVEMEALSKLPQLAPEQNTINEQLNLSELLKGLENSLLGRYIDSDTGEYVTVKNPPINREGVQRINMLISSVFDQNTILSNLEEEEIISMCHEFGEAIVWLIAENYEAFQIKVADRDMIVDIVNRTFYNTLKRAWKGMERESARRVLQINEFKRSEDMQKKTLFGGKG